MSYFQEKTYQFWGIFTLCLIGALWLFSPILAPFIVGFIVAYLLNPIVAKMEVKGVPRWASALLILGVFFLCMLIGLLVAIPLLIGEMIDFIRFLPGVFASAQEWVSHKFPQINIPQSFGELKSMDADGLSGRMGSGLQLSKNIVGNIQLAKRKFRVEFWRIVMFVCPFDKAVVDVIAVHDAARIRPRQNDPRRARPAHYAVALKEVVAKDQVVRPAQNGKVPEPRRAVVAQFHVVRCCVEHDALAVRHIRAVLERQELTPVDQHPLTPAPDGGQPAIQRARDETVAQVKGNPRRRQHDAACNAAALKLDIRQGKLGKLAEPAEIQQVFEPLKGKDLRARRIIQR